MENLKGIDFLKLNKILIAKLRHHGDVLLSSPVFSVLKKRFPHLEIDAYIYRETYPMLEGHSAISNFHLYDKNWKKLPFWKRYFHEMKLLFSIRKKGYDLVINLTEGDRGAIAAKVSKAPFAIGFDPQGQGMKGKHSCYTHIIKHTPKPRHTVEKQLDALRCLGIFPTLDERDLFFHIPEKATKKIESLVPEHFVLLHPVSRWMFKTLPAQTMIEVGRYFQERGEIIVLSASSDPEEIKMNQKIAAALPGAIDLSGKISLKEFGALIKMSRFLFTVDSVSLHLASALKKPVAAVFGPTCDQNWGPYQNVNAHVISQPLSCRPCYQPGCGGSGISDCLETLSADEIIKQIHKVYQEGEALV